MKKEFFKINKKEFFKIVNEIELLIINKWNQVINDNKWNCYL